MWSGPWRRRDDKSDRWQQLVLGKLPGLCIGRVILENHLSALCLLISPGLVPEITTYFLGRGAQAAAGYPRPWAYECGMDSLSGFFHQNRPAR